MKYKIFTFLFLITNTFAFAQLHGFVKDKATGESLIGASLTLSNSSNGCITNSYGYYSLKVSKEMHLKVNMLGYKNILLSLDTIKIEKQLNIFLEISNNELEEVKILTEKSSIINQREFGKVTFDIATIKKMPLLLGEKDPLKALQLVPGVQQNSEGSSSLSVRGGSPDQNLILLDEGIVYNANHLFGFFSTFNADPIQKIDLYKGAFPARYGGRLSSIIDIKMREGNDKSFNGEGGIGIISSRILFEGPIKKNKSSFLISGRRTYADLLITPFLPKQEKNSYYFQDLNSKLNFKINNRHTLFFSFYTGKDYLYSHNKIPRSLGTLINNTDLDWGNITLTSRLNKVFNEKLFANFSIIYTKYNLSYSEKTVRDYAKPPTNETLSLFSSNNDLTLKFDFEYFKSNFSILRFGGISTIHSYTPRNFSYSTNVIVSTAFENNADSSKTNENALYLEYEGKKNNLSWNFGTRLSMYFTNNKVILNPEPRFNLNYEFSNNFINLAYSKMFQYVHLVSNTGMGLPTDLWIPASEQLKFSSSDIVSLGISKKLKNGMSIQLETYYKWVFGNIFYKEGTNFLGVGQGASTTPFIWEKNLTQGRNWNYGYELTFQKNTGKFNFLGGYTLSWSISKFADLNNGLPFYNLQDRRHTLEFSTSYSMSRRISISTNYIYTTGNALSIPRGLFFRNDNNYTYLREYGSINNFRAEPYHRLDVGLQLKSLKRSNNYWEFSVYNLYNRKNPFTYSVIDKIDRTNRTVTMSLKRDWLLPILPSISYNFKF